MRNTCVLTDLFPICLNIFYVRSFFVLILFVLYSVLHFKKHYFFPHHAWYGIGCVDPVGHGRSEVRLWSSIIKMYLLLMKNTKIKPVFYYSRFYFQHCGIRLHNCVCTFPEPVSHTRGTWWRCFSFSALLIHIMLCDDPQSGSQFTPL